MTGSAHPPIAAERWYAENLGAPFVPVEEMIRSRLPAWAARPLASRGPLRGVAVAWLTRGGGGAALIRGGPGTITALAASALLPGRRRIAILELIARNAPRSRWRSALRALWSRAIERPAIRRAMVVGQVLTEHEREAYAGLYSLPEGRLARVPWALCATGAGQARRPSGRRVLSSGRAYCDWETLFAAAAGAGWELTVVCASADRSRVERLEGAGAARVLCDLPAAAHDALLRDHDVYAMVLHEGGVSAGQVRLMSAVEGGVPVVATRIRALGEYAHDGETALLVAPGDARALRAAIDSVLAQPELGTRLAGEALRRARSWTYADYFAALREVLLDSITPEGRPASSR